MTTTLLHKDSVSSWASPTYFSKASLSSSNDKPRMDPAHKCTRKPGWAKVPSEVISAAQKAGGKRNVFKYPDEDLWHIGCTFGDDVYEVMNSWIFRSRRHQRTIPRRRFSSLLRTTLRTPRCPFRRRRMLSVYCEKPVRLSTITLQCLLMA
jgi:hypothetical protein